MRSSSFAKPMEDGAELGVVWDILLRSQEPETRAADFRGAAIPF